MNQETEIQYYEITKYPLHPGMNYLRLNNSKDDTSYGDPLTKDTMIEILWPNNNVSQHNITEEYKRFGKFDKYSGQTFGCSEVTSFINVKLNCAELGKVNLASIKDIKVRIISK